MRLDKRRRRILAVVVFAWLVGYWFLYQEARVRRLVPGPDRPEEVRVVARRLGLEARDDLGVYLIGRLENRGDGPAAVAIRIRSGIGGTERIEVGPIGPGETIRLDERLHPLPEGPMEIRDLFYWIEVEPVEAP